MTATDNAVLRRIMDCVQAYRAGVLSLEEAQANIAVSLTALEAVSLQARRSIDETVEQLERIRFTVPEARRRVEAELVLARMEEAIVSDGDSL